MLNKASHQTRGSFHMRLIYTLLFSLMLSSFSTAYAQTLGAIEGHVTDDSGEVLPGVVVEIESNATAGQRTTVTRANGSYLFRKLPIGIYNMTVTFSGFEMVKRNDIQVRLGAPINVDITLEPNAVEEDL